MNNGDDLANIFCCSPIIWVEYKKLVGAGRQVLTWPVLAATFTDNEQSARLFGIFSFGVLQC